MRDLLAQLTRFGSVGLIGLVVDVAIFNILIVTVFSADAVHEGPLFAKIISTSVAIVVNWIGNRTWTFARSEMHWLREGLAFALVSVGGMLVSLACLWVSHYLLGFTSVLADNIATNVVGLILGMAFRFTLYKTWVFRSTSQPLSAAGDTP
jgi:putative flippase GtrA